MLKSQMAVLQRSVVTEALLMESPLLDMKDSGNRRIQTILAGPDQVISLKASVSSSVNGGVRGPNF